VKRRIYQELKDVTMGDRSASMVTIAVMAAAVSVLATPASAEARSTTLKTPWGEPDLQGIWTEEFDTPLQRPARFGNQEFFTESQRQELDRQRAANYGDDPRQERGSAVDVGGAYNTSFLTIPMDVCHRRRRKPNAPPRPTGNFSWR
jgi:hypothetical protein